MRKTLTFDLKALQPLVEHARSATEHRPTFDQLMNPAFLKDGGIFGPHGWAEYDQIDLTKVPAGLHFVHDAGWYLMSNGQPHLPAEKGEGSKVVYAKGSGPRDGGGGDDFSEFIELDFIERGLRAGATTLTIRLTEQSMSMSISGGVRPADEVTPAMRAEAMVDGAAKKARANTVGCRFKIDDRQFLIRRIDAQTYAIQAGGTVVAKGKRGALIAYLTTVYAGTATFTTPPNAPAEGPQDQAQNMFDRAAAKSRWPSGCILKVGEAGRMFVLKNVEDSERPYVLTERGGIVVSGKREAIIAYLTTVYASAATTPAPKAAPTAAPARPARRRPDPAPRTPLKPRA